MDFDIGLALSKAFDYSKNKKRLSVMLGFLVLALLFVAAPILFGGYGLLASGSMDIGSLLGLFGWLAIGFVIAFLIYVYGVAFFVGNYASRAQLSKSASAVKSVYLSLLLALIVASVISGIVGVVPIIGFIFSIIAGLMFFFVEQEAVVGKSGVVGSLEKSYKIFMKNKWEVLAAMIVGGLVSLVIALVFLIPLFAVGAFALISALSTGSFAGLMGASLPALVITGIIAFIGFSLALLFSISFKTEVYLQLRKKK